MSDYERIERFDISFIFQKLTYINNCMQIIKKKILMWEVLPAIALNVEVFYRFSRRIIIKRILNIWSNIYTCIIKVRPKK